jgi:hypothetical protein
MLISQQRIENVTDDAAETAPLRRPAGNLGCRGNAFRSASPLESADS